MKKIIVTGSNGQLGREINKFYADKRGIEFVNTDVEELDITDIEAVMELFPECKAFVFDNSKKMISREIVEDNKIPENRKFITYAVWYIRRSMNYYLNTTKNIIRR